jgi:hypothetical protein
VLAVSATSSLAEPADSLEVGDKVKIKAGMASFGEVEVPGEKRWQRRKSAKVAVFSNMALPGLGQVYNGRRLKAVAMIGLMTYYTGRAWIEYKNEVRATIERDNYPPGSIEYKYQELLIDFHRENKKDHIWWAGATYLIGMLDAFVDAHLYDVRSLEPVVIQGESNQHYIGLAAEF